MIPLADHPWFLYHIHKKQAVPRGAPGLASQPIIIRRLSAGRAKEKRRKQVMPPIMIAGIVLIVVILIVALCLLGYVKAPPDQAYIISGFRKHRTLIGKARRTDPRFGTVG